MKTAEEKGITVFNYVHTPAYKVTLRGPQRVQGHVVDTKQVVDLRVNRRPGVYTRN